MTIKFKNLVSDIRAELEKKESEHKGVLLQGQRARGAAHRMRQYLREDFEFVEIRGEQTLEISKPRTDQPDFLGWDEKGRKVYSNDVKSPPFGSIKEENAVGTVSKKPPRVCLIDMKYNQGMPEIGDSKPLIVDQESTLGFQGFYGVADVDYFLDHGESDIDRPVSRFVSELYLNVPGAFVEGEDLTLENGEKTPYYFRTAKLIENQAAKYILEGLIASAILKFDPEVIASREVVGIPGKTDVRMYELARQIVERLNNGLEAARITEWRAGDPEWMRKAGYVVRGEDGKVTQIGDRRSQRRSQKKRVLLLEDVIVDGTHKNTLTKTLNYSGSEPERCFVLVDRREGDVKTDSTINALMDIDTFRDSQESGLGEQGLIAAISRMTAALYLNVFDAFVDYESVSMKDGKHFPFYFKTSELVNYNRSQLILEGLIAAYITLMDFKPEVIVGRETAGIPPEDNVNMYSLAQAVANRLGIESVMATEGTDGYVVNGHVLGKKVLLLGDVLAEGDHKRALGDVIGGAGGKLGQCLVLMDRLEGGRDALEDSFGVVCAMTDVDVFRTLAVQQGKIDTAKFVEMGKR